MKTVDFSIYYYLIRSKLMNIYIYYKGIPESIYDI